MYQNISADDTLHQIKPKERSTFRIANIPDLGIEKDESRKGTFR